MVPLNGKHFRCVVPKCVRPCGDNMFERRTAFFFGGVGAVRNSYDRKSLNYSVLRSCTVYEGWNFNSGNYLFTTDTK